MRILLYDMGAYTQNDIMETLERMGISFRNILYKLADTSKDAYFEKRVNELLDQENYDAVFSVNYYPVLADICFDRKIPYLSWSYDSPLQIERMEDTLGYETNRVFLFDRSECEKYWKKGYTNVFHLPLAVNTNRLDQIQMSDGEMQEYVADISMVGQLYDSSLPELMTTLEDYDKGYLTAIIENQMRLYGCYFLPEVLPEGLVIPVAKHITHMERKLLLDVLSESYNVQLYGPDKSEELTNVRWKGSAGYFDEMPRVFKAAKINLNVSLKCIQSGIPLRALDIMGSGGFLLSNYQPELAEFFVDGEDLVMYTSLEDAVAKCEYYLEHEEERKRIAANGYRKVKEHFSFEDRLRTIFEGVDRKRLLMLSAENPLLTYNVGEIAQAYRKIGWEVYCCTTKDFYSGEINHVIAKGLHRVFVINNTGWIVSKTEQGENLWDELKIPSFNLILDHPMYYDDTLSKAPELGSMLCVDRNHVEFVKRFYPNIKNTFFLPLGGDNELDVSIDDWVKDWKARNIDVLYGGGYKCDLDISHLPAGSEVILEKLLQNKDWTTEYAIECEINGAGNLSEAEIKDAILSYKALDWYIMTYIRVEVIRALVRGGINVTVYGVNWEKFEYFDAPNFIYKGCVSQKEYLKKMKESKIVLNVMPWFKQGTHDRVINAMLAGAVPLTDGSSYMDEVFEKDKDYFCYDIKKLEQLPEIVNDILNNDNVEMRKNAYHKAKEQHRWYERIEQLETEMSITTPLP